MRPLNHLQSKLIVRRPCNVCAMKTTSSPPTGNGSKGNVIKRHASHRIRIKSNDPIAILQIDYPKFTLFLHAFLFFPSASHTIQKVSDSIPNNRLFEWSGSVHSSDDFEWIGTFSFFIVQNWSEKSSEEEPVHFLTDFWSLKFWKCQMPTIFPSRMYFRMMIITKTIPRAIIKCGASFRNR